jgi:hypothetical protein
MIFYRNNIKFRQVSSQVQSQFLNSKSFILQEMTGPDYDFSDTARDTMLHLYRVWTKVLMDFEDYFVREGCVKLNEKMLNHCANEIKTNLAALSDHLSQNPAYYDPEYVVPFLKISDRVHSDLISRFNNAFIEQKIILAYKDLGLMVINHLNHLLFVTHELDNMIYNKDSKPFIYIDAVDIKALLCLGLSYPSMRLSIYESRGILNTKKIALRIVINKETLETDSDTAEGYKKLYTSVEKDGYTITCTY